MLHDVEAGNVLKVSAALIPLYDISCVSSLCYTSLKRVKLFYKYLFFYSALSRILLVFNVLHTLERGRVLQISFVFIPFYRAPCLVSMCWANLKTVHVLLFQHSVVSIAPCRASCSLQCTAQPRNVGVLSVYVFYISSSPVSRLSLMWCTS